MTQISKEEIAKLLQEQIDSRKLSQNQAAKMMGMSAATLSVILNNKWKEKGGENLIGEKMWNRARFWLGEGGVKWRIKETINLKRINELCTDAQENRRMVSVAAETGLGKTTALNYYVTNNEEAYYTLCKITMVPKDFLKAILSSMGYQFEGSINATMNYLVKRISEKGMPLLILDDVGKLRDKCTLLIQVLRDSAEGNCGIVLSGTNKFQKDIFAFAEKDKLGYREIKRRIGYWLPLVGVDKKMLLEVAKDFGITDEDAIAFMQKNCKDYGTLKELMMNYERMMFKLRANEETTDLSQRELLASIHVGSEDLGEAELQSTKRRAA